MNVITLERKVLQRNNDLAESLRDARRKLGTFTVNLIGSPGSGKTAILESILRKLTSSCRVAVIEGDAQTTLDAERLTPFNISVVQVITQGACHLDAKMVESAEAKITYPADLLIIENVGNLMCPAAFDISEDAKVVVLSVAEGEEKPLKYPAVFQRASAVILTKTDLLPHLTIDLNVLLNNIRRINPDMAVFRTSRTSSESFDPFIKWLQAEGAAVKAVPAESSA